MSTPIGRVLPPEEWAEKLVGTGLEPALDVLNPLYSRVVVVEVAGRVVACLAAITTVHVDGLWEAESHRGHAGVGRALIVTMTETLHAEGVGEIVSNADTPEMEAMLTALGARRLPGTSWVLTVSGGN